MCCLFNSFFFSRIACFDGCIYQVKYYVRVALLHEVKASLAKFRTKSVCFMVIWETVFELICHENCVSSGTNLDMKKCMLSQT